MKTFELDDEALTETLQVARAEAAEGRGPRLLERARRGERLSARDLVTLWHAADVLTERLYDAARELRENREPHVETFSPLYMTNTCDAECLMCGMRRSNDSLRRETADISDVEEQLRVLMGRGMQAVALLTGEYRASRRQWAISYVNEALRASHALGFKHILLNLGSIDPDEFGLLLDGVPRRDDGSIEPKVTMCTFQETYSRDAYAKFMGTDPDNPRANFDRRLGNFDRAYEAGIRVANPGILLGLNPDVGHELLALALHVEHVLGLGMEVYVSVPRLRQTAGGKSHRGIGDDEFTRLVALLSLGLGPAKVVITTRESREIQARLAPIIDVISSGSSAVTPYTESGARFPLEASQFEVIDQRPFESVLERFLAEGSVENYAPPVGR